MPGKGDTGTRVHDLLGKYMKAEDPEEKSKFRAQLISAFWDLGSAIAYRANRELITPKRLLLRCGILSPGFLSPEHREIVSRIIHGNTTGEPVYYVDEWLEMIARGQVRPSAIDEVKQRTKDTGQKILDAVEKRKGQRDSEIAILRAKIGQLDEREEQLRSQVDMLLRHDRLEELGGLKAPFNQAQKAALAQIQETLRQLSGLDGQIATSYGDLANIEKDLESLSHKTEGISASGVVDAKAVVDEWGCIRQMAKMCVGRQGNHFPIFLAQFVRANIREIGTRENVIREMAQVEAMDPGLFLRTHKSQTTRIVPNIILLACYGDTGICWEPFEKFNRATSRGRVAIPIFPTKSVPLAVLTAMADLRWQVAKEKAAYYWMEEGITGQVLPVVQRAQAARGRAGVLHPGLRAVDQQGKPGDAEAGQGRARDLLAHDAVPPAHQGQPSKPRIRLQRPVQERPEHRQIRRLLSRPARRKASPGLTGT